MYPHVTDLWHHLGHHESPPTLTIYTHHPSGLGISYHRSKGCQHRGICCPRHTTAPRRVAETGTTQRGAGEGRAQQGHGDKGQHRQQGAEGHLALGKKQWQPPKLVPRKGRLEPRWLSCFEPTFVFRGEDARSCQPNNGWSKNNDVPVGETWRPSPLGREKAFQLSLKLTLVVNFHPCLPSPKVARLSISSVTLSFSSFTAWLALLRSWCLAPKKVGGLTSGLPNWSFES